MCLVHHADAAAPHIDPQRPLTELGHRQAQDVAEAIRATAFVPAVIWHSGKLRARQTGEACLRTCAPFADFRMVRGLQSEDPPEWMRDELAAESRDVLLVGHMPHIARLARLLAGAEMPLHGAIALERAANPSEGWREFLRIRASDQA